MKQKRERFEYGCVGDDEWYFQLKTPDGNLIIHSDAYESENDCLEMIQAMKKYVGRAEVIRVQGLA